MSIMLKNFKVLNGIILEMTVVRSCLISFNSYFVVLNVIVVEIVIVIDLIVNYMIDNC